MGTKQTKITRKSIKKRVPRLVLLCRRGDEKHHSAGVADFVVVHGLPWWCWPSQVSLARHIPNRGSISKAMKELRAHGIVREFKSKEFKKVLAGCSTLCERSAAKKAVFDCQKPAHCTTCGVLERKGQVGGCSIARTSTYPRGLLQAGFG